MTNDYNIKYTTAGTKCPAVISLIPYLKTYLLSVLILK